MDTCEVVKLLVNKAIALSEPKRHGNIGYGKVNALRILVYARLKRLGNDTKLVEHINKHPGIAKTLRLQAIPNGSTVGRWWRHYLSVLEEVFVVIANILQLAIPTKLAVIDSTPLIDLYDIKNRWSHSRRGKFRGFKLYTAVNQLGLPLRALATPGNRFDEPFLPKLI